MNNMLRFYIAVTLLSMTYPANPQKISSSLQDAMENSPFSQIHAWVYFTDKNLTSAEIDSSLNMLPEVMNPRALRRRAKTRIGSLVDFRDISVSEEYVQQINAVGAS
ncbi:MAG: hypothetical protein ACE5D7_11155, partial [Fidelibacterota bacterium]